MTKTYDLPELGEGIESAEVVNVLVTEGDDVDEGQGVLEVETDKATAEVPAPAAGRIAEVLVGAGDTLEVGQPYMRMESDADSERDEEDAGDVETGEAKTDETDETDGESGDQESREARKGDAEKDDEEREARGRTGRDAPQGQALRGAGGARRASRERDGESDRQGRARPASPSVRRFAREIGVDLERVPGSGAGGRASIADVKEYARLSREVREGPHPGAPEDLEDEEQLEIRALSPTRRTIAKRMRESWTSVPQVTLNARADVTGLTRALEREEDGASLTAVLVKVLALAVRAHPLAGAWLDEHRERVVQRSDVHVGVAVDTERGLLVPVLRRADRKSVPDLGRDLGELADRAREGRLDAEDMRGGTATLTNLGGLGIETFTPILVPGQTVILGVGRSSTGPEYVEGRLEPRERLPLSLTFDHRLLDGADAARVLGSIVRALEDPWSFLLEG